jgi:hypothetical protein
MMFDVHCPDLTTNTAEVKIKLTPPHTLEPTGN